MEKRERSEWMARRDDLMEIQVGDTQRERGMDGRQGVERSGWWR